MSSVVLIVFLKLAAQWVCSLLYQAAKKVRTHIIFFFFFFFFLLHNNKTQFRTPATATATATHHAQNLTKLSIISPQSESGGLTVLSDFHGSLLKPTPSHLFPYFMLVALEGGSPVRGLLLLLSSPILWVLGYQSDVSIRIMTFITFCMLRVKDMDLVGRAVLPKFYIDNLNVRACEALMGATPARRVVVVSAGLPRVMVEGFVKEYLGVEEEVEVVGCELQVSGSGSGCYYTGLICGPGGLEFMRHKALKQLFGEVKADVGLVASCNPHHHHLFIPYCKESYMVDTTKDKETSSTAAAAAAIATKKPTLVFHDSRLAVLPTPLTSLSLLLFLPLSLSLSASRILLGLLPPYPLIFPFAAISGIRFRSQLPPQNQNQNHPNNSTSGSLYVCTHRTLLDPVMLAAALQRPVPAVTYSLSPFTEAIAPMRTVRLTRIRDADSKIILNLLRQGDLTICPEGTTCREPYLLRFSPLFAELSDSIVPVAMEARGTWFYGTTATGFKWLDPLFFFMNPHPGYRVQVLEPVPEEMTCGAGGKSGSEVANWVQMRLGEALGYQCTGLTRRDKYMMLAGNEGLVKQHAEMKS